MKKCIQCENELSDNAQFCPSCGAKQPELVNTQHLDNKEKDNNLISKFKLLSKKKKMASAIIAMAVVAVIVVGIVFLAQPDFRKPETFMEMVDNFYVQWVGSNHPAWETTESGLETYYTFDDGEYEMGIVIENKSNKVVRFAVIKDIDVVAQDDGTYGLGGDHWDLRGLYVAFMMTDPNRGMTTDSISPLSGAKSFLDENHKINGIPNPYGSYDDTDVIEYLEALLTETFETLESNGEYEYLGSFSIDGDKSTNSVSIKNKRTLRIMLEYD